MKRILNQLILRQSLSFFGLLFASLGFGQEQVTVVCEISTQAYLNESYAYVRSVELLPGFKFEAGQDAATFSAESIAQAGAVLAKDPCEEEALFSIRKEIIRKVGIKDEAALDALTEEEKITRFSYVDGLLRGVQNVIQKGSPDKKDVVQHQEFDPFDRVVTHYLPYEATTDNGGFHADALREQIAFYENELEHVENSDKPFSETQFEQSPLNRVLEVGSVGDEWQLGTEHTTKGLVEVNQANEVRYWRQAEDGHYFSNDYYPEGSLIKSIREDEEGQISTFYIDPFGNTVYVKIEAGIENGQTTFTESYNIFDEFLRTAFVISPEGVKELQQSNVWSLDVDGFTERWVNSYEYDRRHRLTANTLNGSESNEMVYDRYNKLVLYRNAIQKNRDRWNFIKYDYLGRPIMNAEYSNLATQEVVQASVNTFYADTKEWVKFEVREQNQIGYSCHESFPTNGFSISQIFNIMYYDHYDFNVDGANDFDEGIRFFPQNQVEFRILGYPLGGRTRILDTQDDLQRVVFYDDYNRVIKIRENNELNLNVADYTAIRYNDEYESEEIVEYHSVEGSQVLIKNRVEYDHLVRPLNYYQSSATYAIADNTLPPNVASIPEIQVCNLVYNELGNVIEKNFHERFDGSYLQSLDYTYNIRGWLTHINNSELTNDGIVNDDDNDLFGLEFLYNGSFEGQTRDAASDLTSRFDGLLSGVKWQTKHTTASTNPQRERTYTFQYDRLNRLTAANYTAKGADNTWSQEVGAYSTAYTYDLNGNLQTLKRYAMLNGNAQREVIDDLQYRYNLNGANSGNQLSQVIDQSTSASRDLGYKPNNRSYTYDNVGNITFDAHQNVFLEYNNFLNLNTRVQRTETEYIEYTLDAKGNRLAKTVIENGIVTRDLHYIGSCVYDGNVFQYFLFAEGRVKFINEQFIYEYHIKDHLGNARVMFEEDATTGEAVIVQEHHYYPFGMRMEGVVNNQPIPTNENTWLFNGQELQNELGLNWYAFSMRCYDPAVGRWFEQDPYNEFFSPYVGIGNNPVNFVDPTGGFIQGHGFAVGSPNATNTYSSYNTLPVPYGFPESSSGGEWTQEVNAPIQHDPAPAKANIGIIIYDSRALDADQEFFQNDEGTTQWVFIDLYAEVIKDIDYKENDDGTNNRWQILENVVSLYVEEDEQLANVVLLGHSIVKDVGTDKMSFFWDPGDKESDYDDKQKNMKAPENYKEFYNFIEFLGSNMVKSNWDGSSENRKLSVGNIVLYHCHGSDIQNGKDKNMGDLAQNRAPDQKTWTINSEWYGVVGGGAGGYVGNAGGMYRNALVGRPNEEEGRYYWAPFHFEKRKGAHQRSGYSLFPQKNGVFDIKKWLPGKTIDSTPR